MLRVIKEIPTLIMVTIVAGLIWAFAEAETLRQAEVTPEVSIVRDPTGERWVRLVAGEGNPGGAEVIRPVVRLEGPADRVDEAQRVLRQPLRLDPYEPGMPTSPGDATLDLKALLRARPEFQAFASAIASVEPPRVAASVESLDSRELPVDVHVSAGELDGPTEARPAKVRVRAPRALLGRLAPDAEAVVTIDEAAVGALVPGRRETIPGVRVTLPAPLEGERGVRVEPARADVALTLRGRTPTSRPLTVPVQVVLASVEQNGWDIAFDARNQFIADVTVTGPAEVIRQIDDKKLPVVALLPLSFTELEGGRVRSKEVVFTTLPPTQAVLKFDAPSRVVGFSVARRNGTSPKP